MFGVDLRGLDVLGLGISGFRSLCVLVALDFGVCIMFCVFSVFDVLGDMV